MPKGRAVYKFNGEGGKGRAVTASWLIQNIDQSLTVVTTAHKKVHRSGY